MANGFFYVCKFCQDFTSMTKKVLFDHLKKEHFDKLAYTKLCVEKNDK